jgi:hypothetical protein
MAEPLTRVQGAEPSRPGHYETILSIRRANGHTVSRPSSSNTLLMYKLARKPIYSMAAAERVQAEMLDLLRQSSTDPLAYAGLTYCGPRYCGRVGCSEACWFGHVRRTLKEKDELRRLIAARKSTLRYAYISRPEWSQDDPILQLDPLLGARLVRRVLNGLHAKKPVAFGGLKVEPRGDSYWQWYLELLVAGPKAGYLESAFRYKRWMGNHVEEVRGKDTDAYVDDVLYCNIPGLLIGPRLPMRIDFYNWLLQVKPGSRFIRYSYEDRRATGH